MYKSNVLISGATGWLGREILNIYAESNFEKVHLNLISSKSQEINVEKHKFKVQSFEDYNSSNTVNNYFDFAFLAKNKLEKIGPQKFKETNLKIVSSSTNLIKRICPTTVVLSSSGAIYNIKKMNENEILYSDLKKIQEEQIVKACAETGSNLIISRIFNLSGRGIPKESNFALSDLVIKGIKDMDLVINSNYSVTRRYSDITQLLRLLVQMADKRENCVFDSGGVKIELRTLAKEIITVIKSKSKVVASEIDLAAEQDNYYSDSFLYEKLLIGMLGEESLTIEEQIQSTRNSLFVNI
jgi:nucleoside-diphosphate-sugar epimerase